MFVQVLAETGTSTEAPPFDIFSLLLPVALALLIFMMFRKNRKMKQQVAQQRTQMVPGTEVMTNFGLFGTILSVDEENNKALIEISPGTTATVHSQTLSKVVTQEPAASDEEAPAVPDDASSITDTDRPAESPDRPAADPDRTSKETADETLDRLNRDNARDTNDKDK
ncbi:preprotein translocase subunit YajC [Arthrobacter sp. H5]|uniref:preprotein translocase subunit YajC n=1 Tax=Arthrobacter sp. H5 TaxID=1267973 RepID=UPI000483E1BB|nr:preprotein translocase subunit YajC [Arthrobacter sp. H5]